MSKSHRPDFLSTPPLITIKTWWVNRLVGYFIIPLPLFAVAIREFHKGDFSGAVNVLLCGFFIVTALEIFFFGFKVVIDGDRLVYWPRPSFLCRPVKLEKHEVKNIEFAHFGSGTRFKSANIAVNANSPDLPKQVLRLSSFSPADVRKIIAWLERT
ncbi:hypothetical protein RM530_16915 [Algiphilus sp. W345]|uniref:Photosystem I assembly protein Ycf4 n=1 Tax=Banduia mediterranea TaxID=3075609 RepID=A0ABU2WMC7_9GAMM|nr:hypothetical protein [Algiphilus sp. W345]MDT0499026.1 hypothetical protein [Algiphilus sp. W345]